MADQEVQPALDGRLVLARLVRLAGAEERQQGQAGGGVAGLGRGAGVAALAAALGRRRVVEAPAAVGHLVLGQPLQRQGHGRFAAGAAAARIGHQLALPLPRPQARRPSRPPPWPAGRFAGPCSSPNSLSSTCTAAASMSSAVRISVPGHVGLDARPSRRRRRPPRTRLVELFDRSSNRLPRPVRLHRRSGGRRCRRLGHHPQGQHQQDDHVEDHAHQPTGRLAQRAAMRNAAVM